MLSPCVESSPKTSFFLHYLKLSAAAPLQPDPSTFLAEKGYTPKEYILLNSLDSLKARETRLKDNLNTTINHVFEDSVVSFTNYYQMKNDKVVSYPDNTVLSIDKDERGGKYEIGIRSAVWGALKNPNQVVLLYSPPGLVVFDNDPHNKFKDMKPYVEGQIYMMYSDGNKVHNVAISTSGEDESLIAQLMPDIYCEAKIKKTEIEQITHFITNPLLTGVSIDVFLDTIGALPDKTVFTNKDGVSYSLHQTLSLINQSLAGLLTNSPIVEEVLKHFDLQNISETDIHNIYGALAQNYMREKGINSMILGGSCGGTQIDYDPLAQKIDTLSSSHRLMTQVPNELRISKDYKNDPNLCRCSAASGPHFHCPGQKNNSKEPCSHAIEVGHGTTFCPVCGTEKTC